MRLNLVFDLETVLPLLAHTADATLHEPTFGQLYEGACRLDGKDVPESRFPRTEHADRTKVPAGLWLVKDEGIYLMSNGRPGLKKPGGKGNVVVYAKGYGKGCAEDGGGDDSTDFLSLEGFEKIIAAGRKTFTIEYTETHLSLSS